MRKLRPRGRCPCQTPPSLRAVPVSESGILPRAVSFLFYASLLPKVSHLTLALQGKRLDYVQVAHPLLAKGVSHSLALSQGGVRGVVKVINRLVLSCSKALVWQNLG